MTASACALRHPPVRVTATRSYRAVVELLVALHAADPSTSDHLWRVAERAIALGEALGLPPDELRTLWYAGLLHDVGKIGLPEEILHKAGTLDATERALVRLHPELGAALLEDLEGLEDAATLVLHHQERFDGRRDGSYPGYPTGLAGDDIPLGARILAVADAYDAMVSDRPYRPGLTPTAAAEELRRESGRQFDPRVVAAFLGVLDVPVA
jgi:HD-GYP domain-containing protein (c-di-GMP phosphodiesterase class II)